jgi:Glu-tRNA(Gln) amidotransferase subunit E-like FAD-binding protein
VQEPWQREARYSAAGVPKSIIHYLIRRGGANMVDRLADSSGADLRRACFLFGEKLVYLKRAGVDTKYIPFDRWAELFRHAAIRPVLWEAWEALVRSMAASPDKTVADLLVETGLHSEPAAWRDMIPGAIESAEADAYAPDRGRIFRLALTRVMSSLRGRVPATQVIKALEEAMEA